jgi:hypothetical protein
MEHAASIFRLVPEEPSLKKIPITANLKIEADSSEILITIYQLI